MIYGAAMPDDANERLTDLEVRYAHQARLLDELSGVLFEQQRTIEGLERRVRELEDRLGDEAGSEKPPHY